MATAVLSQSPTLSEVSEEPRTAEKEIRKLFVGNITYGTTRADLKELFETFGDVLHAVVIKDKNSCKRKYYGFVTFLDPYIANLVITRSKSQHGIMLNGRKLYVASAFSWHQPYHTPDGVLVLDPWKASRLPAARQVSNSEFRPQGDEDVDESLCFINILNDDCLMHIFSYLNCYERIAIERVCERWQCISQRIWKSTRELSIKKLSNIHKSVPAILQRCGSSLKRLDLSHETRSINREIIIYVSRCCEELEELRITHSRMSCSSLRPLSGPHLRLLDLSGCSGVSEKDLSCLLMKCPVLEQLSLAGMFRLSGWCLGSVRSKLLHLTLDDCTGLDGKQVANNVKHLKKLDLSANSSLSGSDIKLILDRATDLEELKMAQLFPLLSSLAFSAVADKGEKLTFLDLKFNDSLTDELLISIASSCVNMKHLNVEGCCSLDNIPAIVECLSTLKHLETLVFNYLPGTTDACMQEVKGHGFPSLKRLEMRGSPFLGNIAVASVLSVCPKLEYLDISGCQCVSSEGLSCAIPQRKISSPIEIVVGGTSVSEDGVEIPSTVILCFHNYCSEHLRPDFVDEYLLPMLEDYSDDDFEIGSDDEYDFGSGIEYDSDMSDSYDAFEGMLYAHFLM